MTSQTPMGLLYLNKYLIIIYLKQHNVTFVWSVSLFQVKKETVAWQETRELGDVMEENGLKSKVRSLPGEAPPEVITFTNWGFIFSGKKKKTTQYCFTAHTVQYSLI